MEQIYFVTSTSIPNREIKIIVSGEPQILNYRTFKGKKLSGMLLKDFLIIAFKNLKPDSSLHGFIEMLSNAIPSVMSCPIAHSFVIETTPAFDFFDFSQPVNELEQIKITFNSK